jgi:hypothetical protein
MWDWITSPVGLTIAIIATLGYLCVAAMILRKAFRAPIGYEDADGFHYGVDPKTKADFRARRPRKLPAASVPN